MTVKRRYRLPAAEGVLSGEIEAIYWGVTSDLLQAYTTELEGYGEVNLSFPSLLEEVRPPAIDDPVELPLFLEDVESDRMPDRSLLVSTGRVPGSKSVIELTAKGTPVTGNATVSISIDLTAEQSRDLARAAWLLGTREQS